MTISIKADATNCIQIVVRILTYNFGNYEGFSRERIRKTERDIEIRKESECSKTSREGNAMDIDILRELVCCLMTRKKGVVYFGIYTERKQQTDGFFEPMNSNCSLFPCEYKTIVCFRIYIYIYIYIYISR